MHTIATARPVWLERYLHRAFAHRHAGGEWFRLADDEVHPVRSMPAADRASDLPYVLRCLYSANGWKGAARTPEHVAITRSEPRKAFHAEPELFAALDRYVSETRPMPTESAALRDALAEYLQRKGFWPPAKSD